MKFARHSDREVFEKNLLVFIIPARLEDCDMPESLRHIHRVDLFVKGGYKRLVRALRG